MDIIIKSVNTSQEGIINDILRLHSINGRIDLDVTYSKGVFYKSGEVGEPTYKTDLTPQTEDTIQASSDNLPFEDDMFNTVVFDPPFVISGKTYKESEGGCKISKRFSCYHSFDELKNHYSNTLKELHRVLKNKGIVIMKLQNTISSGKQHMTHYFVVKEAIKHGFYIKDEFVLLSKSKMTSFGGRWKTQQHAMKYHSFFIVLQKNGKKVDYE